MTGRPPIFPGVGIGTDVAAAVAVIALHRRFRRSSNWHTRRVPNDPAKPQRGAHRAAEIIDERELLVFKDFHVSIGEDLGG